MGLHRIGSRFSRETRPSIPEVPCLQNGGYTARLGESPSVIGMFDDIKSSRRIFYLEGIVRYRDAFGKTHKTEWCLFIKNLDIKELQFCKSFNDMH